jgi:hypothetical protein
MSGWDVIIALEEGRGKKHLSPFETVFFYAVNFLNAMNLFDEVRAVTP